MARQARPLGRGDWLAAALRALEERGVEGVKVLPLARALGVSRGSFYWHFRDRADLLEQLLHYWEHEMTDAVIAYVNRLAGTSRDRIWSLMEAVAEGERARFDPAVRAWALYDPRAAKAVRRVDRKRLRFATDLFVDAGFTPSEAEGRGQLLVSSLMGDWMIFSREPARRRRLLLRLRHQILADAPRKARRGPARRSS